MAMIRRFLVVTLGVVLLPLAVTLAPATAATRPTLSLGDRGSAVVTLQQRLTDLHYLDVGPVDGVFGRNTKHAVVAFQKVQGITRDGVVGPVTWRRLDAPFRPKARYSPSTSSIEVDLTRQVVYYVRPRGIRGIVDASTGSGELYMQYGVWHRAITPTGRFHIYSRYTGWQSGPLGPMYRPHYFYKGYALHGSTSVPPYPASHGCVRVTVSMMDRLVSKLWIGMPVAIYRS